MSTSLIPDPSFLRVDLLRSDDSSITMLLHTTDPTARCPICATISERIHSHYHRTLADLPWNGIPVHLQLTVRRFFCSNDDCGRRIFTERLPGVAAPYARRTVRLTEAFELIGFALGGEAGSRVLAGLQMGASPDTILRVIRAGIQSEYGVPRVLGVDDFAFRRGHRYGTILVDLEQRQVIDLLPDRKPDTLIAWLEEHGTPEIISRDRGGGYAEAARRGAPDALQVADRFHLLQGLSQTLERIFLHKRSVLKAVTAGSEVAPETGSLETTRASKESGGQRREDESQERHADVMTRHEQVHALHAKGVRIVDIARRLGISRKTVYADLRCTGPPERKRPMRNPRDRVLAPYEPYLLSRWEEGCRNGMQLWREIREQGYAYSRASVGRFVAHLRREGQPPHPLGTPISGLRSVKGPAPRRIALLCLQPPDRLDDEATTYLEELAARDETIATASCLSRACATMVRERQGEKLDEWLQAVEETDIPELCRFAAGLRSDYGAVRAGLTEIWSNGQTEGHMHRLKLVKRQMYGRANFDLLRQRILRAA